MFTLFVNGVPVLKLSGISELPARQGREAWLVADEEGHTIASYQPKKPARPAHRHATESASSHFRSVAAC